MFSIKYVIFAVCLHKVWIHVTSMWKRKNIDFPASFVNLTWTLESRCSCIFFFLSHRLILNYWLTALMAHVRMGITHLPLMSFSLEPVDIGPWQLSFNGSCWENCAGLKPQGAAGHRGLLLWSFIPQQRRAYGFGFVGVLVVPLCFTKQLFLLPVLSDA